MRRTGRSVAAMFAVVAAATIAGVVILPSAGAQKVANPGAFTIVPSGGAIVIKSTVFDLTPHPVAQCGDGVDNDGDGLVDTADPGCSGATDDSELANGLQPKVDVAINGTVDANGNVSVPINGIVFPPAYIGIADISQPWVIYVVTANVVATAPATGTLDPLTGNVNLQVKLRIKLSGMPYGVSMGADCGVGTTANPLTLNLTTGTSGSVSGTKYSPTSGAARLVDSTFAVPGATGCTTFPDINYAINDQMKLPSPSGSNSATINGVTTPVLTRAIVPRILTTPANAGGPVPLTIQFDASQSTVTKAPATYSWAFTDGTTASGPTVTKTFETAGVHVASLTVTDADGDSATTTKVITADPGTSTTSTSTSTTSTSTSTTTTAPTTTSTSTTSTSTTTTAPTTTSTSTTSTSTTTTAPTTTSTTPTGGRDRATVNITGRTTYANSGESSTGNVAVVRDQFGIVSAKGTLGLPGTSTGSATVTVAAQRFWIFQLWTGQVSVYDPGAGVSVAAPVFGQVSNATGTNAVGGTSSWFTLGQFPDLIKPFTIAWSVDDVS